ncbi:replication factor C subunit 1-like [Mercenaria mercenaria]|uniref:replication factor C subunit 1-like n=1 Tax=Mercenaria mercenaria TaxID=6596 RepID=UPI00234EDD87|nr:replication factor C subunit 1-like [Mercenaria mercenaria]
MDIRSFFSPGGAKKSGAASTQKPGKDTDSGLTKIKNGKEKHKEDITVSNKLKTENSDINGNKKNDKDAKKKKESKSRDRSKDKSDSRHKGKSREKNKEKVVEENEVIEIDDDSLQEKPKKDKKEKGKNVDKNLSEKDEVDDEAATEKKRGKKRKKQVSSDEDFDVKIDDDDEDDDMVVKKTKNMKKKGKKIQKLLDSDSDEDPLPKDKKQKKSRKKQTVVHIGGAGEYTEEEVKPKKTFLDNFLASPSPQKKVKPNAEPTKTEVKKEVSATDFFGKSSVHRVERKITHVERKPEKDEGKEASVPVEIDDVEMHSDDDFERTLELLDEEAITSAKKTEEDKKEESKPVKEEKEKTSLSSKLANKAKQSVISPEKKHGILVADTPDSKRPSPKKAKMEFVMHRTERKSDTSPTKPKESPTRPDKHTPPKKTPDKGRSKTGSAEKKISPAKTDSETPGHKGGTGYRSYLNRAGPQALGSKEIPEGAENCLEGLTFVITGVLESFERDESKSMVERYGGKVTGSLSKKTDYLVAGRDPGQAKMSKAESLKTKIIDEDQLLDLIRTRPGKKSKYTIQAEESFKKENSLQKTASGKLDSFKRDAPSKSESVSDSKMHTSSESNSQSELTSSQNDQSVKSGKVQTDQSQPSLLWVDKYKPSQMKQIIGQTGDKSNAKKLLHWLNNWHRNQAAGVKPVTGKFFGGGGSGDGAGFKAALLSGPPGIGKTTTATIVCKEAGFSYVELNASDTRNAKSLKEVVSQSVGNTSIVDYIGSGLSTTHGHKHCLIMDEVDGMSGNEDRGGVGELVNLIKNTKIPIITMCNDRNHPKMRTLSNHCFDLRFQRPRVEQIKAAVMSIAFKEGLKIPPPAVNEIIIAANQDMRQVIHNLSLWTAADKAVTYDQVKSDAQHAKKDMKLGPFDVCRKVFVGGEETNRMTLNDKSDLFFHDYNIAPLFVQENYVHVIPYAARNGNTKHLSLLARSADALCDGDVCEKRIRTSQSWGLLPLEAMYASVLPGEYMRGNITQMIAFPSWLGKNSTTGKTERILQELRTHMRLEISGDKKSLNLDYLPFFRQSLTQPLIQKEAEGVPDVIKLMDEYDIVKDDFDNIMDITKWPNSIDPLSKLSTKTKAAFTRTYNKEVHMTPYSTGAATKKKRGGGANTDELELLGNEEEGGGAVEEEEEEGDDLETDTMIKKKTKGKGTTETKGKGKGPAKGKGESKGKGKGKGKS